MAGAKKSKSTKKFEKNHLKDTIDRRKEFKKIKQRLQVQAKKKQRAERQAPTDGSEVPGTGRDSDKAHDFDDMNDDQFFQKPFEISEESHNTRIPGQSGITSQIRKRSREDEFSEHADSSSEPDWNGVPDDGDNPSDSGDDIKGHKNQLGALAQKDPDFYKYLRDNDAELLDFDDDDDLAGVDALSASHDESSPSQKQKIKSDNLQDAGDAGNVPLSVEMVRAWSRSMSEQRSVRALRQVVLAFRAAAHMNDDMEKRYKYSIPNAEVYHEVLTTAVREVPTLLNHHLPVKQSAGGKVRIPSDTQKFKTLSPLIKSHTSSLHYLLSHLSDDSTLKVTLESLEPILHYLLQFRKFLKLIIKSVVSIWSAHSSTETSRVTAFLLLRRLMIVGDGGLREAVLKSAYEGIVKGSRHTTIHTLAGINLMKNSAAELWGIDQKVGYTTGFTFIRQLAIHLRGSITKPTRDSYKTIYNSQFVHSLDFWSRVLSMHCNSLLEAQNGKESQLRPLIYPTVQITLGVMRLIPTSTYFPLRFLLSRSLLRISQATGTYIPLASALLEVLNSNEMKKPPKAATLRPLDFDTIIRAPASYLKTRVYQDGVGEQVIELLAEFFVLWTKSIAYPEMQLPVTVMLKRWLRSASSKTVGNKNAKVNQGLLLVVQKSEANARWIAERRNAVTFTPKDRAEVEGFLKDVCWQDTPLGAFVVGQRKIRENRIKVLEQGRHEEDKRRKAEEDQSDNMEIA